MLFFFLFSRDPRVQNNMPIAQDLSVLTKTVATLFGNIFAVMANVEVIAAAKPTASMDLTTKHREMKAGPAGTRLSNLQQQQQKKEKKNKQFMSTRNHDTVVDRLKEMQTD